VASGVLAFTAVISPPVLFAVERGNIDILIFFLSVVTFYFSAGRDSLGTTFVQCGLIVVLSVLKLYPIASATVLAHKRWGYAGIVVTGLLAIVGFFPARPSRTQGYILEIKTRN
jgi:hypothetical protein